MIELSEGAGVAPPEFGAAEAEETVMAVLVSPRFLRAMTVSDIHASGDVPSIEVATLARYSRVTPETVAEISVVSVEPAGTERLRSMLEVATWNFRARSKRTAILIDTELN